MKLRYTHTHKKNCFKEGRLRSPLKRVILLNKQTKKALESEKNYLKKKVHVFSLIIKHHGLWIFTTCKLEGHPHATPTILIKSRIYAVLHLPHTELTMFQDKPGNREVGLLAISNTSSSKVNHCSWSYKLIMSKHHVQTEAGQYCEYDSLGLWRWGSQSNYRGLSSWRFPLGCQDFRVPSRKELQH